MKKIFTLAISAVLALSLTACGSSSEELKDGKTLADVWATYEASVPQDERAMTEKLQDDMLEIVYGLTTEDVLEHEIHITMIMTQADEALLVKVSPDKAEYVKEKILERQASVEANWATYLPDQHEAVQNYTLMEKGDYILFSIGANTDKIVEAFEGSF